jgi:glycosyltransferase involved in cell wall biosynthesis
MPKVSVIIPTYNRARFVVKAIDSVLRQSFQDCEILVIDDGSTDDTREVLSVYSERIRYIYQKNSGVSSARNTGILQAKGEWISFLDSDDEWTENYLLTQMAQVSKVPQAVAHITNGVTILPGGERNSLFVETSFADRFKTREFLVLQKPLRTIVKHASWFLPALTVRRDVLLEAGLFDVHLSIAEDIDVVARVARRGPIAICRNELVHVFRREESTINLMRQSEMRSIYRYKAFGKVYSNLLDSHGLALLERAAIARALSSNWRALGNVLVMAGRTIEAREFYKKSLLLYPSLRSLIKYGGTFLTKKISTFLVRKGKHMPPGEDDYQFSDS